MMRFGLSSLLLALGMISATSVAQAQVPSAEERAQLARIHEAREHIAGDRAERAQAVLQEALAAAPEQAAVHCVQGALHRLRGETDQALSAFAECVRLARRDGDALSEARGLSGRLQLLLADGARRTEAREAAVALLRFAESHRTLIDPSLPRERLISIELITERDAVAAEVRARREARAAQNASSDE